MLKRFSFSIYHVLFVFPNVKRFIKHFSSSTLHFSNEKNLANHHVCARKIDDKIRAVRFNRGAERTGNLTIRKRDDSCPMETDSAMSSRNQSDDVTPCDDTCGRDYSDGHFDRVMWLAAVRLSASVMYPARNIYSLEIRKCTSLSPPPSLPPTCETTIGF